MGVIVSSTRNTLASAGDKDEMIPDRTGVCNYTLMLLLLSLKVIIVINTIDIKPIKLGHISFSYRYFYTDIIHISYSQSSVVGSVRV